MEIIEEAVSGNGAAATKPKKKQLKVKWTPWFVMLLNMLFNSASTPRRKGLNFFLFAKQCPLPDNKENCDNKSRSRKEETQRKKNQWNRISRNEVIAKQLKW